MPEVPDFEYDQFLRKIPPSDAARPSTRCVINAIGKKDWHPLKQASGAVNCNAEELVKSHAGLGQAVRVRYQPDYRPSPIFARGEGEEIAWRRDRIDALVFEQGQRPRHVHRGGDQENPIDVAGFEDRLYIDGILYVLADCDSCMIADLGTPIRSITSSML